MNQALTGHIPMLHPYMRKMNYHYPNKYYYETQRKKSRKRKAFKAVKTIVVLSILAVLAIIIIPLAGQILSGNSAIIGFNYHTLKNPTYNEMINFIRSDRTNENTYNFPDYVCEDFSRDTQYNAIKAGYRCGVLNIQFESGQSVKIGNTIYENGHAIICFETSDQGLVFIEPQHDRIVAIKTGCSFSQLNDFVQIPNDVIASYSISWIVADIIPW